ncbi:unnamed protein product [Medioppia subpectinata]|uniref:Glucosidase II beta subunit N-terminal domain-containing protein n=1 Tax=Medioppia subpectinata TaxID=1979941 RepID=A0A7R9KGJ2_9ACAR|nr:unnamed protein product [Medioppia subpectinata]CAG2103139.1 unnamed protein product [Medioppia subpectinata]
MFKQWINCCQNSSPFRWLLKRRRLIALVAIICVCFLIYQLLSLKALNGQMSDSIARVAKHMVHKYSNQHPVTTSAPEAVVDRNLVDQMKQSMDTNAKEVLNQIETNYDINKSIDGHIGQQLVSIIGVLPKFATLYAKTSDSFRCVLSGEQIPYHYLNDDYCDCVDGSDEPSTNACPHNKFYCTANSANSEQHFISSAKVNDGICDCCDGSDEYKGLSAPLKLTDSQKETIKSSKGIVATPPCPNRCPNR